MITSRGLLREVDRLAPGARIGRTVAVARELQAADPSRLSTILADLMAGDAYGRRLGVVMAEAAGRADVLSAATADPDASVASLALSAAGLADEAIAEVLHNGPLQWRRLMYRRLRRERRTAPAVRLLPMVRERWGDAEAVALLSSGSAGPPRPATTCV